MDVVSYSKRPVAVTHANPNAWQATPRNLHHDLLLALSDTGGMVGFSLYPHHLKSGSECSLEEFSDMASNMIKTYGSKTFGIGSDLCQGQPDSVVNWMRNGHWRKKPEPSVKFPKPPTWFKDNTDFLGLAKGLSRSTLSDVDVNRLVGKNWMSFLEKALVPHER
jgi:microsomal dipeptidase-like Zn-dependent dipeptidase